MFKPSIALASRCIADRDRDFRDRPCVNAVFGAGKYTRNDEVAEMKSLVELAHQTREQNCLRRHEVSLEWA